MKKFIINTCFFILFVILVFTGLHFLAETVPNDYKNKSQYLMANGDSIKILNLGNSQSLYSINPVYFSEQGFNLANVSQTPDIDYLLLEKFIPYLNNLEVLIIQVSYTSLFESLGFGSEAWRIKNYQKYYHIGPYFDHSQLFKIQVRTERNNLLKLFDYLKGQPNIYCNEYGFDESYSGKKADVDFLEAALQSAERHKADSDEFVESNLQYLRQITALAESKNIRIIIYTPPVHPFYLENLDSVQLSVMKQNIGKILERYKNIIYLDYSDSRLFSDDDFYDADHLNGGGAEKMTLILDSVINRN